MLLVELVEPPPVEQHSSDEPRRQQQQRHAQRHAQRERIDVPDSPSRRTAISSFKSVQPSMTVNYGAGGSGKGRTDLASGVVNYAGSDSTIPSSEMSTFKGKTVLYFPVVIGPITLVVQPVRPQQAAAAVGPRSSRTSSRARSRRWNNSAIAADNPGVTLPSTAITIAVRSDSSGTTQNFSLFLQRPRRARGRSAAARPSSGPPRPALATATAGWRRPSSPPPGPSGTWTTPTPRPPG